MTPFMSVGLGVLIACVVGFFIGLAIWASRQR